MVQIGIIGFILMTNLGVTIFAVKSYGSRHGVGLIYEGDCSTVKRLDQWLHLLINLLGTGMLSASNYCMQLQAAPTRENVNAAHAKDKWLDIGIPSLRNLKYLSMWRRCSWALLALTSIPIHLIYNSAVFQSLSSHNYTVVVVKDSFLNNASWSLKTAEDNRAGDYGWEDTRVNPSNLDYEEVVKAIQRNASIYDERNISACFDLYDDYFNPQGNAIILVKNETLQSPPEDSLLLYVSIVPRSDDWSKNMWALGNGTGHFAALSPPKPVTKWFLGPPYYEVSRCIVQPPEGLSANCRFEYSPPIMFTICIMNMIKAAIMLSIWAMRRWQNPRKENQAKEVLYTLGDAIASFMREPCEQTIDMGLATNPIAVFVTLLAGLLLVIIIIGMGLRRYDGTMPMVSTNSLAISAACHVLREDQDGGYLLPVQWGVLSMTGGVGKCAFTTAAVNTVKLPENGPDRVYK
ncbi:hypothetical protein CTAM01_10477 [Colletotrichum tamarilloi]|uniref:DUF6536 domain-containing protein n=1 Tax=Colletotrichum tamarilloi TaxID=1209934 RepID=A0ABQ9R0F8_9PEZI|nr:uncharacterized protein CTAM01_10477 [Colletotrichum tamarilloi]KAK1490984.1 hypothetical protein CTAM01_10477 [Colletotrichum tamarilloi]